MSPASRNNVHKYLIGTAITVSLLLGGGTDAGLWSDALLQVIILLAVIPVLSARDGTLVERRVFLLVCFIMVAPLLQLLPLPASLVDALRPEQFRQPIDADVAWLAVTTGLGSTLLSFTYVAVLGLLFLALLRMPGKHVHAVLPFVMLGIACNAAFVFVQYSASSQQMIDWALPYPIYAGLFANRNHLSSLLYVSLPFLVYFATFRDRRLWAGPAIVVMLLILLAAGSRAGAVIGAAAVICSMIVLRTQSRWGIAGILTAIIVLGIYAMGTWTILDRKELSLDFGRFEFLKTTVEGIKDNWLLGVGYGTFPRAYQAYEDAGMIFSSFVNHAHNDYAELVFEGGVFAAILIFSYVALLVRQVPRLRFNQYQKAALLSIVFLLTHSVVDYPLRTMALAVTFVWLNAVIFHSDFRRPEKATRSRMAVRHDGRRIALPISGE